MDLLVVILSLMHVVAGSLWVGFAVFISFMLGPVIDDAGPGAAGIMPALGRRGIMTVLPVLAMGTVLSGIGLYWRGAGGQFGAVARSAQGLALGLSGLAAVVALLVGILVTRPAMMGAGALLQSLASAPAEERAQRLATATALRARGVRAGRYGAVLLLLSAAGMAVAKYL
jgi:uncharacterized membrane protein